MAVTAHLPSQIQRVPGRDGSFGNANSFLAKQNRSWAAFPRHHPPLIFGREAASLTLWIWAGGTWECQFVFLGKLVIHILPIQGAWHNWSVWRCQLQESATYLLVVSWPNSVLKLALVMFRIAQCVVAHSSWNLQPFFRTNSLSHNFTKFTVLLGFEEDRWWHPPDWLDFCPGGLTKVWLLWLT